MIGQYIGNFTVTAYCGKGINAFGHHPKPNRSVAGPRSMPLGTKVYIEGVGYRTLDDRMALGKSGFDVYFKKRTSCVKFGRKHLKVWIEQ